jgi:hypothetical protein
VTDDDPLVHELAMIARERVIAGLTAKGLAFGDLDATTQRALIDEAARQVIAEAEALALAEYGPVH